MAHQESSSWEVWWPTKVRESRVQARRNFPPRVVFKKGGIADQEFKEGGMAHQQSCSWEVGWSTKYHVEGMQDGSSRVVFKEGGMAHHESC